MARNVCEEILEVLHDLLRPAVAAGDLHPVNSRTAGYIVEQFRRDLFAFHPEEHAGDRLHVIDPLQDLSFRLRAKALEAGQPALPAGLRQDLDIFDPHLFPDHAYLLRAQARYGEHVPDPFGYRLQQLIEAPGAAGGQQVGYHRGDRLADSLHRGQLLGLNKLRKIA